MTDDLEAQFMEKLSISELGIPDEMASETPDEEIIYDWDGGVWNGNK